LSPITPLSIPPPARHHRQPPPAIAAQFADYFHAIATRKVRQRGTARDARREAGATPSFFITPPPFRSAAAADLRFRFSLLLLFPASDGAIFFAYARCHDAAPPDASVDLYAFTRLMPYAMPRARTLAFRRDHRDAEFSPATLAITPCSIFRPPPYFSRHFPTPCLSRFLHAAFADAAFSHATFQPTPPAAAAFFSIRLIAVIFR
jgi:hypothetical protein